MGTPYNAVAPQLTWFAKAPTEYLLDGLKTVLLSDSTLQPSGGQPTTVRTWEGDPLESENPNTDELPLVRVTPVGEALGWKNEGQQGFNMLANIDMYVPGVNVRDLLRLEHWVFKALFPDDSARKFDVGAMLVGRANAADPSPAQIAVISGKMRRVAFDARKEGSQAYMIHAQSVLEILFYRNS